MSSEHFNILIVDDEVVVHRVLEEVLAGAGRSVSFAATAAEALAALSAGSIDLMWIDKNLPDTNGVELARQVRRERPDTEVILITAYPSLDSAVEAVKIGAFDYVTKPFDDVDKLGLLAQNALDKVRLKRQRESLLNELHTSEQRYALAARAANDGLWDWNLADNTIYFSSRWKEMLGYQDGQVGNSPDEWLGRVHEDDRERLQSVLKAHLEGHLPQFEDEHRVLHRDAIYRWMLNRGMATFDGHGRAVRMAGSQTDMTMRRVAEHQMRHDALHDSVTQLANRVLFLDRVRQTLARSRRRGTYDFAVALLDLDRFKIVNESLGHSVGDEMLVATARRLESCLRAEDSAARLGGDEFALLIEDVRGQEDAVRVAERIQAKLAEPLRLLGREVFTTSSIGIAVGGDRYERPEDLLRDADVAMYRAKEQGRARQVVFDPSMHTRASALLELDTALRRGIERDEFIVHYQPLVGLASGQIVGFEALVRWQHPERGLVPPAEFIPVAEETGLIVPLSHLVLDKAAKQARIWLELPDVRRDLYMSVNVSGKHLVSPGLADEVRGIIAATRLPPGCLRLEITESVIVENTAAAAATLDALRRLEVPIYLDDFGTGYSSLSYLHRLPIDAVKIDRSFISNLGVDGENTVIVHTIITLARVLGMEVTAEGIETKEQLVQLRALRCDHGQGYFFSRPLDAAAADALLRSQPRW